MLVRVKQVIIPAKLKYAHVNTNGEDQIQLKTYGKLINRFFNVCLVQVFAYSKN